MSEEPERRISDEVVAAAQAAKQAGGDVKAAERSFPPEKKTPGCCGGEEEVDLDALKQELNMDDHIIVVTALLERLGGGVSNYVNVRFRPEDDEPVDVYTPFSIDQATIGGLTNVAVEQKHAEFGLNILTPPKTKSECQKFIEQITDFFSILLWVGCALCFVAYGLQTTVDNLALAIVLGSVVLITGVFGYLQDKKASNLMESFKNMMPEVCTVIRGGGDEVLDASNSVSYTHLTLPTIYSV